MTRSTALLLALLLCCAAACTYGARRSVVRTLTDLDRSFRTTAALPPLAIEEPPEPFTLRRRDFYVGARGRKAEKYLPRAEALFSSRLDLAALPYGTRISVWSLGEDVVAAEVDRGEGAPPLFAAPALTKGTLIRFFDEDGKALEGPFTSRPVEYDYISSGYGERVHPITGRTQKHRGVDLSARRGAPVVSVGDGIVTVAGEDAYAGIHVVVRHPGTGFTTKYFHLDALGEGITAGARVSRGQPIGVVGSTGLSTGPHLHFEVLRRGVRVDPVGLEWPAGAKLSRKQLEEHRALATRLRAMTPEQEILAWQDAHDDASAPAS